MINNNWKRKIYLPVFAALTVTFTLFGCGGEEAEAPETQFKPDVTVAVSYVIDGDTLVTEEGSRIRFLGINTPEIKKKEEDPPDQPWGRDAANFLKVLLPPGTRVGLIYGEGKRKGKYGRTLAYVVLEDQLVNELILEEGYGKFEDYGTKTKYEDILEKAEREARVRGKGVWEGQGKLKSPPYYVASKNGEYYHPPSSEYGKKISDKNRFRITEPTAQKLGLKKGGSGK